MSEKLLNTKVITGEILLYYPHIFEPAPVSGERNEFGGAYEMQILIPNDDSDTLGKVKQAMSNAAVNKWGPAYKDLGGVEHHVKDNSKNPEKQNDPVLGNVTQFRAKSQHRPGIIDSTGQDILDPNDIYSGCIVRASVSAYGTESGGPKTIAWWLNNVVKIKDGERIGGGAPAADDFAEYLNDPPPPAKLDDDFKLF